MYRTIVWATDGSQGAEAALREALQLSASTQARIIAVYSDQPMTGNAIEWPTFRSAAQRRKRITQRVRELEQRGIDIEFVVRRSRKEAADVIADVAAEVEGDLIVCGTHGRGSLPGVFLGSFGYRLMQVVRCPVLVVPERAPFEKAEIRTKAEVA